MGTNKKCEYCDKRGVPIIPLRYAVASAGTGAPVVTDGPAIKLPAKAAHYTRRLLRSGYLYVYDEARDRWESYYVTPQSYFFKLAQTPGIPPVLPQKPFDCPDEGHRAIASCITIPDPKNATKVWFGFSDVEWTQSVRDNHADAGYRRRHMRCVDVKAFAASADAAHCIGVHTIGTQVAEYALEENAMRQAFAWGPFPVDARKAQVPRLVQECENLYKGKAFAVALDDPAAIAAELGVLMQRNFDLFVNAKTARRELAVSRVIEQIESAVREQARDMEQAAIENYNPGASGEGGAMILLTEAGRKMTEEMQTVTPVKLENAANQAWARYTAKYDEPRRKSWQEKFNAALKTYDADFIAPLAPAHVAWMKSRPMADYFECNFDDASDHSGLVYTKTVSLCVGSTQDKAACFDLYSQWLEGDLTNKKNLILRALVLNLEKTSQELKTATTVNLDMRGIPWDGAIGNWGKATERVAEGEADALGRLLAQLGGPVARLFRNAVDGPVRQAVVALGVVSGHPIVRVEITGSKKAMRAAVIRELIKGTGEPTSQRQMERAVSAQLRRMQVYGAKLDGTEKKSFLLMVDSEQAATMPKGLNAKARAEWLASSVRTPEQVEQLNLSSWRAKVSNPGAKWVKGGVPFVFGAVAALLQYNAMQKLAEDDDKAMAHEKSEAHVRMYAGIAALGGTITELVSTGLGKMGNLVPKLGQGLRSVAGWVGVGGKILGFAGALVMAYWDAQQAVANFSEGNNGVGWAYVASSVAGALVAVAILASWTGVGIVLVVILIGITVLLEYIKDNKVQDWLERCVWGKLAHYPDIDTEMRELRIATAG